MVILSVGFMRSPSTITKPLLRCLLLGLLMMQALWAYAAPLVSEGRWYELDAQTVSALQHAKELGNYIDSKDLEVVTRPASTGGHYLYKTSFEVVTPGTYVVDFKSSSVVGRFTHHLFNAQGEEIYTLEGGIQSSVPNPFMLRHGRDVPLSPGHYELVSEVSSPFFLAHPEPYVVNEAEYQQSIKASNAMVLICYGAMLILTIYYAALGYVRKQVTDYMYALFIFGNLFYNGAALLILPDLAGMHWFYLISIPILFSNIAYVFFVMHLLEMRKDVNSGLYRAGRIIIVVLLLFIPAAAIWPNWSLEFDRYGVGIIMLYGLVSSSIKSWHGNLIAKYYLVAILAFFLIGSYSITNTQVYGSQTFYIEHFGMLAVTVEMILLALVLARQFALLNNEKEHALTLSQRHLQIAHTDALTGLPNRYALDQELDMLPPEGVLIFIDIDGLKYYNDNFGHKRGDELLCGFARAVHDAISEAGVLHRIGGDEFAITSPQGNVQLLEQRLQAAMRVLHQQGFEFSGMSYGIAHAMESRDGNVLKYLADTRMYAHKRERQKGVVQYPRKATTSI